MKRLLLVILLVTSAVAFAQTGPNFSRRTVNTPAGAVSGVVDPANGGTGVANNSAATLTRSGSHALTVTTTGTTGVTLPTTGTLATTTGTVATATNLAGGAAGSVPYQTGAGASALLAIGAANTRLFTNAAGTTPEWAAGAKIGAFTRDMTAATGSASVTGVGFKPSAVIFLASGTLTALSIGFDDATTHLVIGQRAAVAVDSWDAVSTQSIRLIQQTTSAGQVAAVSSMDADGFTISWTKVASPSGTADIYYLAFR